MAERQYTLGRGRVYFGRFSSGEVVDRFRYVGNTPELNFTVETEQLDHVDQGSGINTIDDSVPLSVTRSGTMVMDDIQRENLALFFLGSVRDRTIAASTEQSEEFDAVMPDDVVVIGLSSTNRVGVRNLSNVSVTDQNFDPSSDDLATYGGSGGEVLYEEGRHYTVNLVEGLVTFLDHAAIRAGPDVQVNYDTEAATYEQAISGSVPVEGAMRFVENNAEGQNNTWIFPKVSISPNGDLALKGQEWRNIPFNIRVLKPSVGEAVYINGVPQAA